MRRVSKPIKRRALAGLLVALWFAGRDMAHAGALVRAGHRAPQHSVGYTTLVYTDPLGRELARMRPVIMRDITHDPGILPAAGERLLLLGVRIWNTGDSAVRVAPEAFVLWGADGRLYRPRDVYDEMAPDDDMRALLDHRLSAVPIQLGGESSGIITYCVPMTARLCGILFTPEPEHILVLADFSTPARAILD